MSNQQNGISNNDILFIGENNFFIQSRSNWLNPYYTTLLKLTYWLGFAAFQCCSRSRTDAGKLKFKSVLWILQSNLIMVKVLLIGIHNFSLCGSATLKALTVLLHHASLCSFNYNHRQRVSTTYVSVAVRILSNLCISISALRNSVPNLLCVKAWTIRLSFLKQFNLIEYTFIHIIGTITQLQLCKHDWHRRSNITVL